MVVEKQVSQYITVHITFIFENMPVSIVSPIPYDQVHKDESYETEKIEIDLQGGGYRKRYLKVWSASRGVEGLLYCYDIFAKVATKFTFDLADYEEHLPCMFDDTSRRDWENRWNVVPTTQRSIQRMQTEFEEYVTEVTGSDTPRDDLIKYVKESDECKKKRNVDVREHVNRIITLCLSANRLVGTTPDLTDNQITLMIFSTFPEPWQDEFTLNRGRAIHFTRTEIISYMENKKKIQDKAEDQTKRKRKQESNNKEGKEDKQSKKKVTSNSNTCRHHGTHPWSECSLNPKSSNYHLKPNSPFYRSDRGGGRFGRGGGRSGGRFGGRGGRYNNDYGGRGRGGYAPRQQNQYNNNNNNDNRNNDNYFGGDRGNGRGQQPGGQDSKHQQQHGERREQFDQHYGGASTRDQGWSGW